MIPGFLRKPLERAAETTTWVVLVLLFFVLSLGVLTISLPKGSSLRSLMDYRDLTSRTDSSRRGTSGLAADGLEPTIVAQLTGVHRTVKNKPARELAWADARENMPLEEQHAVQTFARSGATISFAERGELTIGENSLVVLSDAVENMDRKGRTVSLVLLGGEISGRIAGDARGFDVEVVTEGSVSRLTASDVDGRPTSFDLKVNEDGSSTLAVHEGAAEVSADGKTVRVEANQAVTVEASGAPGRLVPLPSRPRALEPANGAVFVYRDVPPRVTFRCEGDGDADAYRFLIASDSAFTDVVHDSKRQEPSLTHGNLKAGSYYWRASGMTRGLEGRPSRVGRVRIVQDTESPRLEIAPLDDMVQSDHVALRGRTEPGVRLHVAQSPVPVGGSGEFECDVPLRRGLNLIVVEAVDEAGNTTYDSMTIHARY